MALNHMHAVLDNDIMRNMHNINYYTHMCVKLHAQNQDLGAGSKGGARGTETKNRFRTPSA